VLCFGKAIQSVFTAEAARIAFIALLFPLATLFASLQFITLATFCVLAVDILVKLSYVYKSPSMVVLIVVLFVVDLPVLPGHFDPYRKQFTGRKRLLGRE
jgi:hypothetical protein